MAKLKPRRVTRPGLIFLRLKNSDPQQVYAGLRWVVDQKGYKPGWAAQKFKTIFGKWPRFGYVEPEVPSGDLRSFVANQRRNYGSRMKRRDAKIAATNVKALARISAIVAEIERLDRETGGKYRETSDWEPLCIVERIEKKMILNGCRGYLEPQLEAAE